MNEHIYQKASFPGKIVVISTDNDVLSALEILNQTSIIGFDTETKPSFRKGEVYSVSLLQLSTDNDAFLFRLLHLNDLTPFISFFENESIIKTGVAIRDDIKGLQKQFPFLPKGFVELADLAKQNQLKNFGLKGMTEEVLGLTLSKRAKLTNWEAHEFTHEQKMYAATDAWIGREIYLSLIKKS
jgi:ribonuclease D